MHKVLAIDPGSSHSAYVKFDGGTQLEKDKIPNEDLYWLLTKDHFLDGITHAVIEHIQGFGGQGGFGNSLIDTIVWYSRFAENIIAMGYPCYFINRKAYIPHLCGSAKAGDAHVTKELCHIYTPGQKNFGKGTKKAPGFFYGFSKDIWQAMGLAHVFLSMLDKEGNLSPDVRHQIFDYPKE